MERLGFSKNVKEIVRKYKYVVLIVLLGIVFLLIPERETADTITQTDEETVEEMTLEQNLSKLLSKIEHAGRVEVLLSYSSGERILYQTDEEHIGSETDKKDHYKTVIITDSSRGQQAVVRQVIPPTYLGAVILCQGGDRPEVKLAIVEAVADATGLTVDKITVLKMK